MSLYEDLGVPKDADEKAIKRARNRKARAHHPDQGDGNADAFNAAQRAYVVLINPVRRAEYDRTGNAEEVIDNSLARISEIIANAMNQVMGTIKDPSDIV